MNISIVKDEIKTLNEELRSSNAPAAQKRIKEMIDERTKIVDTNTAAWREFNALESEIEALEADGQNTGRNNEFQIRKLFDRRCQIEGL